VFSFPLLLLLRLLPKRRKGGKGGGEKISYLTFYFITKRRIQKKGREGHHTSWDRLFLYNFCYLHLLRGERGKKKNVSNLTEKEGGGRLQSLFFNLFCFYNKREGKKGRRLFFPEIKEGGGGESVS